MRKRYVATLLTMIMLMGTSACSFEQVNKSMDTAGTQTTAGTVETEKKPDSIEVEPVADTTADAANDEHAAVFEYPEVECESYEEPMANVSYAFSTDNAKTAGATNGLRATGGEAVSSQIVEEIEMLDWNTEEYNYTPENLWMSAKSSPFSTFAADVDTASYANVRRKLLGGQTVPKDAVRIEEMINYFSYDYPEPKAGEPFSVTTQIAPCPWNEDTELLLVGMKAKDIDMEKRTPSNLVFLIDVSGSMNWDDRLPLVKRSFRLLCEELQEGDRISIVTYASGDKVVLEGVSGEDKLTINEAMDDLSAGGGTNGSAGINTAYDIAEKYFIEGGNNRVILATDGDLNIGITDQGSLTRLIEEKAKSNIFLSVLGFGQGNISDARMESLADHGNGNYSYIDGISEARKVLIQELGGTLFPVAKDVKLQVEFNPAMIKGYRLIGYENRVMAAESFADDTKDGGELGAGHRVTALFEIAKTGSKQAINEVESKYGATSGSDADWAEEYLTVNVRYKEPDGDTSTLLSYPVDARSESDVMSENMSWAAGVAQFGMILKDSEFKGTSTVSEIKSRLGDLKSAKNDEYREEFLYMLSRYQGKDIDD